MTVEGIVIQDGWSWTFVVRGCDGVRIDNVKLLCSRVENGDGFDIVNSRNVSIRNSFVRSDDDCITPKGMEAASGQAVENLRVEHCVLWSDRAHIWRIGCESRAEAMRNFVFRDIDVLHFPDLWTPDEVPFCISLEPAEDMAQENILFENVRVRHSGQRGLIDVRPKVTQWAREPVPGRIRNVLFRNVSFSGPAGASPGRIRVSGPDPSHGVANVRFENVTRNGELVTEKSPGVELLGFVSGVSFDRGSEERRGIAGSPVAGWENVTINPPPKHPPFALAEARRARGVIAVRAGAEGPSKLAAQRLQEGIQRAIGTTLPVVEDPKPVFAIVLGDSTQALAEGLSSAQLAPDAFEIRTTRTQVLIVGNGLGVTRGVDAFLAHFLGPVTEGAATLPTDLIITPASIVGGSEKPADFTVASAVDDSTFQLSKHAGKVVVLHFLLKTECPFCIRHTHDYAALAATTPDVVHVFLKPDSVEEIRGWAGKLDQKGLAELPRVYRDPEAALARRFGIPDGYQFHGQTVHFPALVVLDGTGRELFRYVGKNNSDRMPMTEFKAKLAASPSRK